jgi:hypothetical protein
MSDLFERKAGDGWDPSVYEGSRRVSKLREVADILNLLSEESKSILSKPLPEYIPFKIERVFEDDNLIDREIANPISKQEYDDVKNDLIEANKVLKRIRVESRRLSILADKYDPPNVKETKLLKKEVEEKVKLLNKLTDEYTPRYSLFDKEEVDRRIMNRVISEDWHAETRREFSDKLRVMKHSGEIREATDLGISDEDLKLDVI